MSPLLSSLGAAVRESNLDPAVANETLTQLQMLVMEKMRLQLRAMCHYVTEGNEWVKDFALLVCKRLGVIKMFRCLFWSVLLWMLLVSATDNVM